jgi:aryl-alcohol dehydrogenase-like predicted oxidoreductase
VLYRRLGRTELNVSAIGVGSWQFSGEWGHEFTQSEVTSILGRARELGINVVDTAECYGDHLAEELIGAAIAGHRDEWVVATKFGHEFQADKVGGEKWWPQDARRDAYEPREVVAQLDRSLRALGTDHVDIYQFHSGGAEDFATDGLWETLQDQVDKGKIRALGISLRGPRADATGAAGVQAERALEVGAKVVQVLYNRLERRVEERVLPACVEQDLGVLVREPLANGLLGGKYSPGRWVQGTNDWRAQLDREAIEASLAEAERIRETEIPEGVTPAQWALAWCLRQPVVGSVIAGCRTVAQLEDNAAAVDAVAGQT